MADGSDALDTDDADEVIDTDVTDEAFDTASFSNAGTAVESWVIASFVLICFVLPLVILGHVTGVLNDTLPSLGTLTGLLVFGYLWLLIWLAMRWVVAAGGVVQSTRGKTVQLLFRGVVGGAFVGMGFVAGLLIAISLSIVFAGKMGVGSFAFLLGVGLAVGGTAGALFGLFFSLVIIGLLRVSLVFDF